MKDTIIILGGSGMLAHDIKKVFQKKYTVFSYNKKNGDITNQKLLESIVQKTKPFLIINCAAYSNVDGCETEQDIAYNINGYALENIALAAKKSNAIVVHFSTDYVFSGENKNGYKEDDQKNPLSIYGKSKALGEDILLKYYPEKSYIIRTAWLYGKDGKSFVSTMFNLAKSKNTLSVVHDQIGSPTYGKDLAEATYNLIEKKYAYGIYHIVNSERASWYDFAKRIFEEKNIPIEIRPVTTEEFPRPAKRPAYSLLQNTKYEPLRSWKEALKDFLENDYK